jgi:alkane 1-monooxygenase
MFNSLQVMKLEKLKYLTIFLLPLTVGVGFYLKDLFTYLAMFTFFVLVPILEIILKVDDRNLSSKERNEAEHHPFYSWLLYSMLPVQFGYLYWFLSSHFEETYEYVGAALSMGLMCGVVGINVGHELGHRSNRVERFVGELLLLSSMENHFLPYHNRGHHANVGTPMDPATARKNEPLYVFWFRSHFGSYFQAWKIEWVRLGIMKRARLGLYNLMVVYTLVQLLLCIGIYFFMGRHALISFLIVAGIGILLLETVNYIEHYGLTRKKRENGTYESVKRIHSWNANNVLGRVVLFEVTRHSDHHFKADKPYQVLESHEGSPTMPTGYPGMMLLSFIPPLFFKLVNPRIPS